jgi:mannose-6-phosphate isomerase class I
MVLCSDCRTSPANCEDLNVVTRRVYDSSPVYPCVLGKLSSGWSALCASLPPGAAVIAVDGPANLDWAALAAGVTAGLPDRPAAAEVLDLREHTAPWDQILARTESVAPLSGDPDFATLASGSLADLFDGLPAVTRPADRLVLVIGPGAALVHHDLLWYADVPKRYAESAVAAGRGRNLGQRPESGSATLRRLFYIDWPLLDRHRDALAADIDCWIDMQEPGCPRFMTGHSLRASLRALAGQPFRTRPVFNTTPWGGHWAQQALGVNVDARNTALGYELIAPESGILLGQSAVDAVEVPLQLLVSLNAGEVLGPHVCALFGSSFPIRFDYLDTMGGGSLSVHCHPRKQYMSEVFGWPYPQHESYYVMASSPASVIFLGLRADASLDEFSRCAHAADEDGIPFDIQRFVQTFPADRHQLFLVPAGTPHGSGAGNVVLEVSATPYLYSLRFYDWLRRDSDGTQRPVHVAHAFSNLNQERRGPAVSSDLLQQPRIERSGEGWSEELIGALPEMFFEVRRLVLAPGGCADLHTGDRFHVLNVVEGEGALVRWSAGSHSLAYAETLVVPASVGDYQVMPDGPAPVRVVQAVVR